MQISSETLEGNAIPRFDPACYFNLAIEQIQEAELALRTTSEFSQTLTMHLEVFLMLSKRFPDTGSQLVDKLDRGQISETFYAWFERWRKHWDAAYSTDKSYPTFFKKNVDGIFLDLEKL